MTKRYLRTLGRDAYSQLNISAYLHYSFDYQRLNSRDLSAFNSGQTSSGNKLSSGNSSPLTIDPPPQISLLAPNASAPGQFVTVTISGLYTKFTQGSTVAKFGAGISVGSAADGSFGPATVVSETSATAQLTVSASAASSLRTPIVQTGVETATLTNGFSLTKSLVSVPNAVGLAQSAATSAIQRAGLVDGTTTTASSKTEPAGDVCSQSPTAGIQVASWHLGLRSTS